MSRWANYTNPYPKTVCNSHIWDIPTSIISQGIKSIDARRLHSSSWLHTEILLSSSNSCRCRDSSSIHSWAGCDRNHNMQVYQWQSIGCQNNTGIEFNSQRRSWRSRIYYKTSRKSSWDIFESKLKDEHLDIAYKHSRRNRRHRLDIDHKGNKKD